MLIISVRILIKESLFHDFDYGLVSLYLMQMYAGIAEIRIFGNQGDNDIDGVSMGRGEIGHLGHCYEPVPGYVM